MTFIAGFILFIAAVRGGALNSVAGGGSFLTFPSLIFAGVRPIQANATSTVALWPGSVASVSAYRKELATLNRVVLLTLGITSLIGGIGGAILLLSTPQATFLGLPLPSKNLTFHTWRRPLPCKVTTGSYDLKSMLFYSR